MEDAVTSVHLRVCAGARAAGVDRVLGMQMWHLTREVTVTGDNGGRQAAAGTLLLLLFLPTRLI